MGVVVEAVGVEVEVEVADARLIEGDIECAYLSLGGRGRVGINRLGARVNH